MAEDKSGLEKVVSGTRTAGGFVKRAYVGSSDGNKSAVKYGVGAGLVALIPFDLGTSAVIGAVTYVGRRYYLAKK